MNSTGFISDSRHSFKSKDLNKKRNLTKVIKQNSNNKSKKASAQLSLLSINNNKKKHKKKSNIKKF